MVGHTGSGKSSIVNLAAKFYLPTEGAVRIDGREIRTLTSHSLHRQMGIVSQQNFLFSGTLLDNIRIGRPDTTEEAVRAAGASVVSVGHPQTTLESLFLDALRKDKRGAGHHD